MSYGPAGMETFDDEYGDDFDSDEDGLLFGDSRPHWNNKAPVDHSNMNGLDSVRSKENPSLPGAQAVSATNGSQSYMKQENPSAFGRGRGRGFSSQPKRSGGFPTQPSSASKGKKRGGFTDSGNKRFNVRQRARNVSEVNLEDFRVAIVNGNVTAVKKFIDEGVNPDAILKSGWTALLHAADCGNLEIMDILLSKGANVNFQKDMYTALMAVCSAKVNSEEQLLQCVDLLLKHGARVNAYDKYRMSPLMYAAREGRVSLCEKLLEHHAEINKQDSRGWTALSMAVMRGHGRLARILLDHKANPKIYTNDGQSPSDIAYSHGYTTLAEILEGIVSGNPQPASGATSAASCKSESASHAIKSYGEMELFLLGLELGHLIPKFQEHHIAFDGLAQVADKDLIEMGISQVGVRKKLLDGISDLHKKEWDLSSLTQQLEILSAADATAILANIAKHLCVLQSSVGYLQGRLRQVQDTTQFVQDVCEVEGMVLYANEASQTVSSLNGKMAALQDEVRRLSTTASEASADLVKEDSSQSTSSRRPMRGLMIFVGAAAVVGLFLAKKSWHTA